MLTSREFFGLYFTASDETKKQVKAIMDLLPYEYSHIGRQLSCLHLIEFRLSISQLRPNWQKEFNDMRKAKSTPDHES